MRWGYVIGVVPVVKELCRGDESSMCKEAEGGNFEACLVEDPVPVRCYWSLSIASLCSVATVVSVLLHDVAQRWRCAELLL